MTTRSDLSDVAVRLWRERFAKLRPFAQEIVRRATTGPVSVDDGLAIAADEFGRAMSAESVYNLLARLAASEILRRVGTGPARYALAEWLEAPELLEVILDAVEAA